MSRFTSWPRPKSAPIAPVEPAAAATVFDVDLIERRKVVRLLPVPEALEHNDDASWSTWCELSDQGDTER